MSRARLVRHSLRAISRYKLRSGFMMLGSLVGVAALTLVVSVGGAAQEKVLSTMRQLFGASSIIIVARGGNLMGGPRPDAARLTIDDVEAVVKELPEIEVWDPQQAMPDSSIRHGDAATTARVLGQSERAERVWSRGVSRGQYFEASDVTGSARVALIGETVAATLFAGEDPIGAEIQVGPVPFRVVGVLERFGTDLHGMDRDNEVVVPISTAMRRLMNVDTIAVAKLLVRDPDRVLEMEREVKRLLRARHGIAEDQRSDFNTITAVEVQHMIDGVQRIFFLYLPLVAGVALLVGAIVSAALMLSSVSERSGEIGLRRAVGARPEDIRLQFLVETAATTLVGGALGILVAVLGVHGASVHMHIGNIFSWTAVGVGVLVSIVTGLLAGVLPARRAARLHPADALR